MTNGPAGGSRTRTVFLGSGGFGAAEPARTRPAPGRRPRRRRHRAAARRPGGGRPSRSRRSRPSPRSWRSPPIVDARPAPRSCGHRRGAGARAGPPASSPTTARSSRRRCSRRATGRSTCTPRCCPGIAARPRSRPRSWPAMATTGVTVIRMDDGLDTGPIVAQASLPARRRRDDAGARDDPRVAGGRAAATQTVGPWLRGEIAARPQPDRGATLTRPLRRGDGRLDPARPAGELERQVRAYQPWPGSYVDTPFGRLVVWSAVADGDGPAAGTFDELGLGVGTGERLRLDRGPAGRRPADDVGRLPARPTVDRGQRHRAGPVTACASIAA